MADGSIIALRGRSTGGTASAAVEFYDPYGDAWRALPSMHVAREGLCAGVIAGNLYAASGFNGTYLPIHEVFDGTGWDFAASMRFAHSGAACAVIDGALVATASTAGGTRKAL